MRESCPNSSQHPAFRIRAGINERDRTLSASSQLSCPPDANSAVVYKTAALPARTLCTPVSSGVPARPAQGHGLATDPGHSFAARDRVANVRRSSSVSRTTTGKGIRDSGLQTASFILPAPDRTASPFGADSDWRTGMADMCAVHDAPRLIVLEHRVGVMECSPRGLLRHAARLLPA